MTNSILEIRLKTESLTYYSPVYIWNVDILSNDDLFIASIMEGQ